MQIAHILRKYDPSEWGGTESVVLQLTADFSAHGVDSIVYAPRIPPDPNISIAIRQKIRVVARRVRAWIETRMPLVGVRRATVARRVRAWIETILCVQPTGLRRSPAACGRGLKQYSAPADATPQVARRVRAWIETTSP